MTISVVLPAYQEAENLKNILPNIHAVLKDVEHEVLVIDTMTPMDDTETVCRENSRVIPVGAYEQLPGLLKESDRD